MNLQPSCWLTGTLFSTNLSNIFSYIWLWFTLVPYLAKGHRRDINNGPGVTQIVPTFWHNIYSNWTGIMAPPQAIPILGQMEDTPVQVSYLWIPGGCHICPRAAGLTSIMAQQVTRIVAPFCPRRLFESNLNNGPSPGHSNLVSGEVYISVQVSYLWYSGGYNDFSTDVSKQIRLHRHLHVTVRHVDVVGSLNTIGLRR